MTKESAARILDPETTWYELWKHEEEMSLAACNEACRMGADALREQQERENPKPLTLDELRQMDGEPVYCVEITGREEWLFRRDGGFADMYGEFTSDDFMLFDNYGKLWWCYRQKPEEGTV